MGILHLVAILMPQLEENAEVLVMASVLRGKIAMTGSVVQNAPKARIALVTGSAVQNAPKARIALVTGSAVQNALKVRIALVTGSVVQNAPKARIALVTGSAVQNSLKVRITPRTRTGSAVVQSAETQK